jgi:lipoprotein-releasing system permease protein
MNKIILYFLKKYISSPKKEWLRFDSIFMVVGIIVSVATLTVALSIFEGYETVLKKTILGVNSHIYVFNSINGNLEGENVTEISGFLDSRPEVDNSAAVIITQAMASNESKVKGAIIRGIDWEQDKQPTSYRKFVFKGSYKLEKPVDAVLGYRIAKELGVNIGDSFKLVSSMNSKITPMGMKPKQQEFEVVGLYRSGMYEYDSKYVFLNIETLAEFNSLQDEYTMLEIKLKPEQIERADYLAYRWEQEFEHRYQFNSWIDFNGNLFSLLKVEKWVIFLILSFLILVASFNVVTSVSTSIIEKRKELGILKAFGATNRILQKIFIGKTLIIAVMAVSLGQILGVLIAEFLSWQTFFMLKGDVYFLDKINVEFSFISWVIIFFVSLFIVFFASVIPLKNIAELEITDILRNS